MSNEDIMGLPLTRLGLGCAISEGRNIIITIHTTVGKTRNGKEKDRVSRKLRLKFLRAFLSSKPFVYDTHSYIIRYRLHATSLVLNSQASCFELPCNPKFVFI